MPARLYTDENVEDLEDAIEQYFIKCDMDNRPLGFAGLAYALGFSERRSLNDYMARNDSCSTPIKRACLKIEAAYEERLAGQSPTGSIFALKNRGWTDKPETERAKEAADAFRDIVKQAKGER